MSVCMYVHMYVCNYVCSTSMLDTFHFLDQNAVFGKAEIQFQIEENCYNT